jgi:two-component system, chemotaxis family, protein-glutamate methylesterase/glutaminase
MTQLVVVGTSLGGLDAVRTLLAGLRTGMDAAIVIVQHRTPGSDGTLVELLSNRCALPLCEPCDRDPIKPGCVYVAPPDYHLLVEQGCFSLSIDAPVLFARPSIDVLFESAANAYGAALLAFVLTGSSQDGAAGAAAVKRAGGRVYVEDPAYACSPTAPLAALAATRVDAVLPIAQLAQLLAALGEAVQDRAS